MTLCAAGAGETGWWLSEPPASWTFREVTEAFDPDNPAEKLGDFQVGIQVQVMEPRPHDGQWLVQFNRPGGAPLPALVAIPRVPDLLRPAAWEQVGTRLQEFPLLEAALGADARLFHGDLVTLGRAFITAEDVLRITAGSVEAPEELVVGRHLEQTRWRVFGHEPVAVQFQRTRQSTHRITIDIWNKGYGYLRPGFRENAVRSQIRRQLTELTALFEDVGGGRDRARRAEISMIRDGGERYVLPNYLEITFRHIPGEYMILEIQSLLPAQGEETTVPRDREALAGYLREQVVTAELSGHRYIRGIPMINQGSRGYCVVATMARVLQFYGFDVEINSLANLAGTLPQSSFASSGGTFLPDAIRAMQQVGYGSPFRLAQISAAGQRAERNVREAVEAGTPILWLIPGHMNLIIGYHPEGEGIVYSDSWGPGHEFKTMPWEEFHRNNQGMFVLRP